MRLLSSSRGSASKHGAALSRRYGRHSRLCHTRRSSALFDSPAFPSDTQAYDGQPRHEQLMPPHSNTAAQALTQIIT